MSHLASILDFAWKLLILVSLSSTFTLGSFVLAQSFLKQVSGCFFKSWSQRAVSVFLATFALSILLLLVADRGLQVDCFRHFAEAQGYFGITRILALIWTGTAISIAFWDLFSYQSYKRKIQTQTIALKEDLHIVSDDFMPLNFGFFQSWIVIPQSLLNQAELPYIVAHERVHKQNRDGLWGFLALLVLRICWFNPIAWSFEKTRKLAVEMATDEKTIQRNNFNPQDYARTLVSLLSRYQSAAQVGTMGASSEYKQMKVRLENLNPSYSHSAKKLKILVVALMLLAWGVGLEQAVASIQLEKSKSTDELMCYQVQHEKLIESWLKVKIEANKCE